MVCPVCHNSYFFDSICVYCACAAAAQNAPEDARPPPLPPQRQKRPPHDPHQYIAMVASRPTGQQGGEAQAAQVGATAIPIPEDLRCPACRFFAGRMADEPCRHVCRCNVCRFFHRWVCPVCAFPQAAVLGLPPQPHHQRPLGLNNTRNLLHPSVPACNGSRTNPRPPTARWDSAVRRPAEGPPPTSWDSVPSADRSRHIQCSPPTSPWDSITCPKAPDHDEGWCPACLYTRAPTLFRPWEHVCLCRNCKIAGRNVCPVCASAA
ncbi:hypothetical protein BAE44_0001771 [Dichanthelium oligosanthes]|uniref:Uncharacterized protein n=1 Tax=Dichanthelium oligosanthes TaxID=888268 RepID=A0A1E5WIK4_9POAL|nr:hypothetical protein BAE44_0001771 [Dichanthelium oligosanthes]